MSVNPIAGVSSLQQTIAAQTAPTADAAQAWEDAMRAAMGDESSPPATAATAPSDTAPPTTASATTASPVTALTPQALAGLVSGSTTAPTDPLITSLSAPTDATTPTTDPAAGSFV
jgi:hypothetical protein